MRKPLRKTNPLLVALIEDLRTAAREHQAPLWRDLADRLARPRRNWAEVNLSRLERHAAAKETVVVPGKLLGTGRLTKQLTVAAFQASAAAREKVTAAGGEVLSLQNLVERNPGGAGVRILG
jgi:large subunit ribosomal protein L18e